MPSQSFPPAQAAPPAAVNGTPSTPSSSRRSERLRRDVLASLVVFLVAVPLSLGIAAASGAPLAAGLIAAAVGGILAGYLGGSPLQVSGPAAGLTVIVASLAAQFPWPVVCAITIGAGLLQVLLSLSRVARAALAISPVVVNAMLAGIGVTIILQQTQVMLGSTARSSAWANVSALPGNLAELRPLDLACGVAVIVVILAWARMPRPVRKIPSQLVAILLVTTASVVTGLQVTRVQIGNSVLDSITLPQLPQGQWGAFVLGVLTIGIVASVESLLSAVAVDRLHDGPRTNYDRELFGQGVANTASGMLGGLPVTGVIVRSSTNVVAGAVTRWSAILHGVWVAVFSVLAVALIEQIPMAALAGLLVYTGAKLIRWADIHIARRTGDLLVYLVTILGVVGLNLLEGVALGIGLSIIVLLWRVIATSVHAEPIRERLWRVVIDGTCSFLSTPRLVTVLQSVPLDADVIVELEVDYLDRHAYQAFHDWRVRHEALGNNVSVEQHTDDLVATLQTTPPRRTAPRSMISGTHAPWNAQRRQVFTCTEPDEERRDLLQPVFAGIDQFHRKRAGLIRPHLEQLAETQRPDAMFISCADSRVVPNLLTNSGPGDLFTVRNVGNLIPVRGTSNQDDTSVDSAVTFAVTTLGVGSVVVCGHSACGAMKAVLTGTALPPEVSSWLRHGDETLAAFRAGHPLVTAAAEAGYAELDQLAILNVAVQVQRLREHPSVAASLAGGTLAVTGLFFDVGRSRMIEVGCEELREIGAERAAGQTPVPVPPVPVQAVPTQARTDLTVRVDSVR